MWCHKSFFTSQHKVLLVFFVFPKLSLQSYKLLGLKPKHTQKEYTHASKKQHIENSPASPAHAEENTITGGA